MWGGTKMDFQPFRGGCMFRFLNVIAIIILLIIIITISSSSSSSSIIIVFSVSYVFDVNSSNLRMEISQNSTATWVKNTKHRYGNHPSSQKQKSVLSCHLKKILLYVRFSGRVAHLSYAWWSYGTCFSWHISTGSVVCCSLFGASSSHIPSVRGSVRQTCPGAQVKHDEPKKTPRCEYVKN